MTEKLLEELLLKYRVPHHVHKHMKKVSAVALFIGNELKKRDQSSKINLTILRQSALLHDFMKLCDFSELNLEYFEQTVTAEDIHFWNALIKSCHKVRHVQAAYDVLKELGEDEVAEIIKKHRFTALIDENPKERPNTWEEKILYYADKRVCHDQIVSIHERVEDGRKRYFPDGNIPENDSEVEEALHQLEEELLSEAALKPEDINEEAVKVYLE